MFWLLICFLNYVSSFAFPKSRPENFSTSSLFERQFQKTLLEQWKTQAYKGRNPIILLNKLLLWTKIETIFTELKPTGELLETLYNVSQSYVNQQAKKLERVSTNSWFVTGRRLFLGSIHTLALGHLLRMWIERTLLLWSILG